MFLIVGLGNPGDKYKGTRHNIGFDTIDLISKKYNIAVNREKFKGMCGEGIINGEKVILLKPTTYMNLSGESVRQVIDFYKMDNDNIVIIYDDISLEVGRLRIRSNGSAGGHNGIKSIIAHIGDVFPRVKIGVGGPKNDLVSHVLGKFSNEENETLRKVLPVVVEATEVILSKDINDSMNKFNSFVAQ